MKNKRLLLCYILVVCWGCKKDTSTTDPNSGCKMTSSSCFNKDGKLFGSAVASYDANGIINRVVSTQDTAFMSFTSTYTANQLTVKTKNYGDWIYKLDNNKRIIHAAIYGSFTDPNIYDVVLDVSYNSDGYISNIKTNEYGNNWNYAFFYENGNLIKITTQNPLYPQPYPEDYVYTFEYSSHDYVALTDRCEPLSLIIPHPIPGMFGKSSKNQLIKGTIASRTTYNQTTYGLTNTYLYKYKIDKDDKFTAVDISITSVGYPSGNINYALNNLYTFDYTCKP